MNAPRVHWLGHAPAEDLGSMQPWFERRGARLSCTRLWEGEALPAPASVDALVVMGGPMNVDEHERHPWLVAEKRFIAEVIAAGRPVLGVCLGAQLIARTFGVAVVAGTPEIGFAPVERAPEATRAPAFAALPARFEALHWHGDRIAALSGPLAEAVPLGASADCPIQGFVWRDRVLALQCHLEATPDTLRAFAAADPQDTERLGGMAAIEALCAEPERFERMNVRLFAMLDALFADL